MDAEASFGRWLRRRRRALDLTQEELAQQVGCSVVTIRKFEADERRPSKQIATRLAECLGIPPAERAAFVTFARTEAYADPLPAPPQPVEGLPPREAARRPGNLPAPLTTLIGREQDVAAARNLLLRPEVRLLTLVGPPGIGKTRLGLHIASSLRDTFADGAWFVPLAPVQDPSLVEATIAQTLGVKESGGRPLSERLRDTLREKHLLLVLDNFEHLLDAAPLVATLLEACPRLKALATSRAPLDVRGERQLPVPPLVVPNLDRLPPAGELALYPSVALFVERAAAVTPSFALTEASAPTIAAICARLDGLPLAIELAAARSRLLPPAELFARLDDRLALLAGGPRDLPPRHRTLRAAIAWSYELLSPAEQTLLARAAVFVGGFSLEAAEQVAGYRACPEPVEGLQVEGLSEGEPSTASRPEADPERPALRSRSAPKGFNLHLSTLDVLSSLVSKSLIVQERGADEHSRCTLLETIREYGLEQLDARGESEEVRRRHAAYYLALAERAEPELRRPGQLAWLNRLETEHNNMRAALQWALDNRETETALRLAGALWRFWELHSHANEGRAWLTAALVQSDTIAPQEPPSRALLEARARALSGAGKLANNQGAHEVGRALCEASLALAEALEDEQGQVSPLHFLGLNAQRQADYRRARELHGACLALSRRIGDRVGTYLSLYGLAEVAVAEADEERALALHEESLELKRQHGDMWSIAWSLGSLALLAGTRGDYARAAALHRESLDLRWQLRDLWSVAESLVGLAGVAVLTGQPERAARLFGASEALRKQVGVTLWPHTQSYHDRTVALARAQLGVARFDSLRAEGYAMAPEEAMAYALK